MSENLHETVLISNAEKTHDLFVSKKSIETVIKDINRGIANFNNFKLTSEYVHNGGVVQNEDSDYM